LEMITEIYFVNTFGYGMGMKSYLFEIGKGLKCRLVKG